MDEVIVIDAGSSLVKAGWSCEDAPRCVFRSNIVSSSFANLEENSNGDSSNNNNSSGNNSSNKKSNKNSSDYSSAPNNANANGVSPIVRGKVESLETNGKMEKLLAYTFGETELDAYPETVNSPILFTEPPGMSKNDREKMAAFLFDKFKPPGICFASTAVLALFASGRTRGIVLECGGGVSHTVPIFEGFSLQHAMNKLNLGGIDVTSELQQSLRRSKVGSGLTNDLFEEIKCNLAYCDIGEQRQQGSQDYELPDGTSVTVDERSASSCADILFDPSAKGIENINGGLGQMVWNGIQNCDRDLQPDLFNNIVISGGTSMLTGFSTRLESEIRVAAAKDGADGDKPMPAGFNDLKIVPNNKETESGYNAQRKHGAWIGGSIFASLETFRQVMVTRQDWEDGEAHIIHRNTL
jgi:actin